MDNVLYLYKNWRKGKRYLSRGQWNKILLIEPRRRTDTMQPQTEEVCSNT
jgi:hypothetical protein